MTHATGSIVGFWIDWMMNRLDLLKVLASSRPNYDGSDVAVAGRRAEKGRSDKKKG
jgi:hypothetical protein